MSKIGEKLVRVREIATRLNLGASAEARYLRAVLVELCSALLGDDVEHSDLELSGAKYPPPELLPAAQPAAGPKAALPAVAPFQQGAAPRTAMTLDEAAAKALGRAQSGKGGGPVGATATKLNTPAVGSVPLAKITPIKREAPAPDSAAELAAAAATTAPQKAPDPNVPDPAGESFLDNLAREIDAAEETTTDGQAG